MDPRHDHSPRVRAKVAHRIGRFLGVSDLFRSVHELRAGVDAQAVELDILRARLQGVSELQAHLRGQLLVWITTTYLDQAPLAEDALVTVVLPTHNRATIVGRAVDSVLAQSYSNWELVVVDDGSDDDTPDVLARLTDSRIRVLRQDNRGLSAARNTALAHATGDYVVYLDDDNVLHPHWLRGVVTAFDRHPDADVVIGGRVIDDERRNRGLGRGGPPQLALPWFDRDRLGTENVADILQVAHRRGLPEAHFDEQLSTPGDWDLIARLTRDRDPVLFPALAGNYTTSASHRLMDSGREQFQQVRDKIAAMTTAARAASERTPGVDEYVARMHELVPGWFDEVDAAVLRGVDRVQRSAGITGDLLEIGAFFGKSAILLGYLLGPEERLVVCDLFTTEGLDPAVDTDAGAYEGLTRAAFEQNYACFHNRPPTAIARPSTELPEAGLGRDFRLVHIDGSHRYEIARQDISNALDILVDGGVVVLDDYLTLPHALGVAAALWQAVTDGQLVPVLATYRKLYACAPGATGTTAAMLRRWALDEAPVPAVCQEVAGHEVAVFAPPRSSPAPDARRELDQAREEVAVLRERLALVEGSRTWRLRNRLLRPARG